MPRSYTKEYFANRIEQGKIKEALWKAMPTNIYYHNVIIALSEMLSRCVDENYQEDVMHKPPLDDDELVDEDHPCMYCRSTLGHRVNCPKGIAYTK